MKYFLLSLISLLVLEVNAQSGKELYMSYCSACHGQQLQGGRSPGLIKSTWLYGGDKKSIIKSITQGIPKSEMMAWNEKLNKKQIKDIAEYILSMQESSKTKKK